MSTIGIKVHDRELSFTNMPTISAGAVGVDSIKFEFDGSESGVSIWDGYTKTCVFFKNRSQYYPEVLDLQGIAKIPTEMLKNEGIIYLGLCGIKDETRLTSTILAYEIKNGVYYAGTAEDEEFAKTNFEQILEYYETVAEEQQLIKNTMTTMDSKISAVEAEQQALQTSITLMDRTIEATQGSQQDMQGNIEAIEGSIVSIKTDLNTSLSGFFNVKAYEAKGDGETDDGWAIQSAIDTCRDFGGGTVYFPAGTYNITRTLFYYSNMTFKFEEGAVIRTMVTSETRTPSIIFAPYFETNIAFLNNGMGTSGFASNRYAVENVIFDGGTIDGYSYDVSTGSTILDRGFVMLTCLCKNIKFLNMTFKNNSGGHCIEVNSSTNVTIKDCSFIDYVNGTDGIYAENLQIDTATSSAVGSKYTITEHTTDYTAPNGIVYDKWYTYSSSDMAYRSLGGYFDFTLLSPGDQYTVAQTIIEEKLGLTTIQIQAEKGFHQCCHNVEIASCYFENNNSDCRVCAIGCHTFFKTGGTENYADLTQDKHSGIKIHDNTFIWGSNRVSGGTADTWRGVIGFGHYEQSAWQNPHIYNVSIHGNMFYRNKDYLTANDSTDGEVKEGYAITACRDNIRYTRENINLPQTKYNIYGNFYAGINGWENGTSAEIYQQGSVLTIVDGISNVEKGSTETDALYVY